MKELKLTKEFITLGQLLQVTSIAYSGGETKYLVKELDIKVNGEKEDRRGRKLYSGDVVVIKGYDKFIIQ